MDIQSAHQQRMSPVLKTGSGTDSVRVTAGRLRAKRFCVSSCFAHGQILTSVVPGFGRESKAKHTHRVEGLRVIPVLRAVLDGIQQNPEGCAFRNEVASHIHVLLCNSVSTRRHRVQP